MSDREKRCLHFAIIMMIGFSMLIESKDMGIPDWGFLALSVIVEVS
jgi:hypothetical protein